MKKFLRKIFTKPVESAPNPGRRAFLGGAGAAAATAAFAGKHAVKQAPEVATQAARTEKEKKFLMDLHKGRNTRHADILPVPRQTIVKLGLHEPGYFGIGGGKEKPGVGSVVKNFGFSSAKHENRRTGLVSIQEYVEKGGDTSQKFTLVKIRRPEYTRQDVGDTMPERVEMGIMPTGWKPPKSKISGGEAQELFPQRITSNKEEFEFEEGLDVYDLLERQHDHNAVFIDNHAFDTNWKPARPNVRAINAEVRKEMAEDIREINFRKHNVYAPADPQRAARKAKEAIADVKGAGKRRLKDRVSREVENYRGARSLHRQTYDGWKE